MLAVTLLACDPGSTPTPPPPTGETGTSAETGDSSTTIPSGTADTAEPSDPPTATVVVADSPYMVLEKRFAVTLSYETSARLQCTSPDDPDEDHRLWASGLAAEVRLYGLLGDTTYDCTLWWPSVGGTALWTGSVETGTPPDELPGFSVSGVVADAVVDEGYVLMSHWEQDRFRTQRLVAVDGRGRIRWYMTLLDAYAGVTGEWLGDALVVGGGVNVSPTLATLSGDTEYVGPAPELADEGWHHEALRTPEGYVLGLQGVRDPGDFVGFLIQALHPGTGDVVWEFDSRPHASELPPPDGPLDNDPYHANAVSWVDDLWGPAVWVSLASKQRIVRIDRTTREITHQIGPDTGWDLVDDRDRPLPESEWYFIQHDPEIVGDVITLFDNGTRRPPSTSFDSRVSRYRIVADGTLRREWSWGEPGWYEPHMGSVQTLPNGHVLVGSAHDIDDAHAGGGQRTGFVAEIDGPGDRVTWRLDFDDAFDSLYRAQYLDGCGLFANARFCPAVADDATPPGPTR